MVTSAQPMNLKPRSSLPGAEPDCGPLDPRIRLIQAIPVRGRARNCSSVEREQSPLHASMHTQCANLREQRRRASPRDPHAPPSSFGSAVADTVWKKSRLPSTVPCETQHPLLREQGAVRLPPRLNLRSPQLLHRVREPSPLRASMRNQGPILRLQSRRAFARRPAHSWNPSPRPNEGRQRARASTHPGIQRRS